MKNIILTIHNNIQPIFLTEMLEARTEAQGQMIKRLKVLIANEGLFSQVIDFFPYPIAIFTSDYILTLVNKAFETVTKTQVLNGEKGKVCILPYKIVNTQLATAVSRVFAGETFFLEDLKNPFTMFSGIKESGHQPNHFSKAVIFPIPADNSGATHGVIVFTP
ncbi:MAG TPA: hypothetical protein GXX46_03115 [Peptococcaceae bacterium]|nr:hypothetical protein [Peptococcaceae bacterium]